MVFVTGGTGLLGSHLLLALCRAGKNVRSLLREGASTNTVQDIFRFWEPELASKYWERIQWVEGDILDTESLINAMQGCDEVYHTAALVSFHPTDHEALEKVNVEGTANVVNVALQAGVRHFCYVSSVAAIGRTRSGQSITEKSEWKNSKLNSRYAISKYGAEREVWRGMEEGLNVVIVNPGLILGPVRDYRSSASLFREIKKGMTFYPPGSNGFVDVRDVVDAMLNLGEEAWGNRYIMVAENISYKEVMDRIARGFGKNPPRYELPVWLIKIAWRFFAWSDLITGKKSVITKESARNAGSSYFYSSEKIENQLQRKLRTTEHIVQESCRFFMAHP
jgi:nucleoside-diphosphate-sugar epimerase